MLAEMFAHARKDLHEHTPGTSSTASLESGSGRPRRRPGRLDYDREGTPRVLMPDFRTLEPVTIQEPTCSVASSHEGGERKSTRVEQSSLQACLRAVTEENRGLRRQHQNAEARLEEMQRRMELELENEYQLQAMMKRMKVKSRVSAIFVGWFRVASKAWRERWKAAEAALAHAESEQLDHDALLRAEEAELRVLRLEATVENQRLRFTQVEQKAFEAQEESASLQATSAEAARKVKNLTEQLSRAEALLVKERARLRNEELEAREAKLTLEALQASQVEEREASQRLSVAEALLVKERESVRQERLEVEALTQRLSKAEAALAEERARLETYESEQREASREAVLLEAKASGRTRQLEEEMEELRRHVRAQQTAKVEAESQAGLVEVERSKLSCKLQLAESEVTDAKAQEVRLASAAKEARDKAEELSLQLQRAEEQRREAEEAARAAEAERQSVLLRLQQAAEEVDLAKTTADAASIEARQLQEILVKAKELDGHAISQIPRDVWSYPNVSHVTEGSEMEEALAEIRRWRTEGRPPKISGSALQRVLKDRIEELEHQLTAARAIRELGHGNAELQNSDASILPGIASAAVAAARDASCDWRLTTLEEELADAKEVQAAAEALMKELFNSPGKRTTYPDGHGSPPERYEDLADEVRQSPKGEVAEAAMSFTSDLLEALAACRLELERARPSR